MGLGKIEYNSITFEFDRDWNEFQVEPFNKQTVNESDSGKEKIVNRYSRDIITARRESLTGTELEQLEEWWEYVRDGSSFQIWGNKNIGKYISFEGKTVRDNDRNTGTFARTGVANTIDPYTGLVTSIAAATPRFQSGKFGAGILIEDSLTNILDNTEDFSHADWTTNKSASMTVTANQIPAPNSTESVIADKLVASDLDQYVENRTAQAIGTTSATFSVWLKCLSGTCEAKLIILESSASADITDDNDITITTEWVRYSVTYTTDGDRGANTYYLRIQLDGTAGNTIAYAWGAQLELKLYETSYIADAGTRNAETLYYSLDTDNFNKKKWSISYWCYVAWPNVAGTNRRSFTIYDNAGSDESVYQEMSTSGSFNSFVKVYGAGANLVSDSVTGSLLTPDTWHHVVITFDSTISNGLKHYLDGALKETSTNDPGVPEVPDRLYIGSSQAGANQWNGQIDDFIVYKKVLSANEVLSIYNSAALGIRRNYFSAVRLIEPRFNPIKRVGGNRWDLNLNLIEVL